MREREKWGQGCAHEDGGTGDFGRDEARELSTDEGGVHRFGFRSFSFSQSQRSQFVLCCVASASVGCSLPALAANIS
jgi:hypothetical protein